MDFCFKLIKVMRIVVEVIRACCSEVPIVDLSNCGIRNIEEVPIATPKLLTMRELYLNNNQISKIPEGIVTLGYLLKLRLDSNKLSEFPQVVCQLTNLMSLYLSCNNIRFLPSQIENLKNLGLLFINNTGLEYIPEQIGGCMNLMGIVARKNCIQRLPESLGLLNQLTWLNFEENKITELPQSFDTLTELIHLNLRKNRLSSFPDVVNDIRTIRRCLLDDNCIETITPRQIELSAFMKVLDITNNPATSSEELLSIFPNFRHVVYNKLDGDLDHAHKELDSDSMELIYNTFDFDTSDESADEHEIERNIRINPDAALVTIHNNFDLRE